jgi:hydrogenase-4 component B
VVLGIAFVFGVGYFLLKRRAKPTRRGYAWDCGFGPLNARMQYTSSAFSQPIRRVFAPTWKIEEPIEVQREAGALGRALSLRHQLHVYDWSWLKGYLPIGRLVLGAARRIGHIQTGSIHTYLLYSFVTLLVLLVVQWLIG